jgi:hypothetical protein
VIQLGQQFQDFKPGIVEVVVLATTNQVNFLYDWLGHPVPIL